MKLGMYILYIDRNPMRRFSRFSDFSTVFNFMGISGQKTRGNWTNYEKTEDMS